MKRRIAIMALATADTSLLETLARALENVFGAEVEAVGSVPLPPRAYDASRDQYRATVLLDALAPQKRPEWERLLGIADVDLYSADLNFVFGQADAERRVAIFSLVRLHTTDHDRFVRRVATEAIHELGHTYGLGHCDDRRCAMWFSNTLDETDRKGTGFCVRHATALRQAIGEPSPPAKGSRAATARRTLGGTAWFVNESRNMENESKQHGEDAGPFGRLVDERQKQDETPEPLPSGSTPTNPRAASDDYASGTAEHDDEDEG